MQNANTTTMVAESRPNKFVPIVIFLLVLLAAGFLFYRDNLARPGLAKRTVISPSALEERYGLRVKLIAVTGAGGFVDVRLKIVDGEKVEQLLKDTKNFPTLFTAQGVTLNAPADTKSQKIEYVSDGNLFIMYPNSGNAVQRGDAVTIVFDDIALEPIEAK